MLADTLRALALPRHLARLFEPPPKRDPERWRLACDIARTRPVSPVDVYGWLCAGSSREDIEQHVDECARLGLAP